MNIVQIYQLQPNCVLFNMKIKLITVGQKPPQWASDACDIYQKRIQSPWQLTLCQVPLAKRGKNTSKNQAMQQEALTIQPHLEKQDWIIVLDAKGRSLSTEQWADQLLQWQRDYQKIALVIGGPDGLDPQIIQQAHYKLSLSAMTLPHPMAKVVLLEQLYRAQALNKGHPYHK